MSEENIQSCIGGRGYGKTLQTKSIKATPVGRIGQYTLDYACEHGIGFYYEPIELNATAKEMFIDIGFKQGVDNDKHLIYVDIENDDFSVVFHKKTKTIDVNQTYDYSFNVDMLKAINKQAEELEWFNE